mgnify:CR=1 FL=1
MKYPNKEYIEHLRRKYPPGTRLQLSCMEDEFPVPPGSMGTDSFSRLPSPKEKAGDAR